MSIKVEYLTLPGLEQRLNAIDTEDEGQFTAVLSLSIQMRKTDEDGTEPVAVLVTKTEIVPEFEAVEEATPEQLQFFKELGESLEAAGLEPDDADEHDEDRVEA